MKKILLMVPCFNEEERLDFSSFSKAREEILLKGIELTYLFLDDGSSDQTKNLISNYAQENQHQAFSSSENMGKGNIIFKGYQHIRPHLQTVSYDWIGYWDVDLATPLQEIPQMLLYAQNFGLKNITAIWASRISRLGSDIQRKMYRHYLGRVFVTLTSIALGGTKVYDSQCGAKLFTPESAEMGFRESFISRWIFDVEILLRLNENQILEYPLSTWSDKPGSKVKIFREIWRVSFDLFKIRKKYKKNL